ncbi:MAG: pyridoxal phosphate-dependent aminotransferase [Chloroflexi bacterium]|nr:pyridoxal phosphate-dependent aminotransferase [Chloroflexota bacterium]
MLLLKTNDYLEWARAAETLILEQPDIYNLYSSAVSEPTAILHAALQRAYPQPLLARSDAPISWGHPLLRQAIAREYNVPDEEQVLMTSGCSMAYILVCRALLQSGDHAVVEVPTYQPFIRVLDTMTVPYTLLPRRAPTYGVDVDELETLITPRTRLIVLSHVHNPSGAALDGTTLDGLARLAHKYDVYVLVDQVFGDFVAKAPIANHDERFITIASLSKVYGLSLLRTGWIIAAPAAMARLRPIHILYDNSASRITQAMTTLVFDDYERYRQRALDIVNRNRALVQNFAAEFSDKLIGAVPAYGCTFFPQLTDVGDVPAFVERLAQRQHVVVVPGDFFGMSQHIRIGFGGDSRRLQTGLERLADALRNP